MKEKRTELSEIGEFGLIDRLKGSIKKYNSSTLLGIGDDAAVIDDGNDLTLVSTDLLTENIHFDLAYTPLKHLGYKAVAVNVSDIAAMNGIPKQITVGLALSNRFSVEAIEDLYKGIALACEQYKVDLIGGDTTSSRSGLVISITVLGKGKKGEVVYRNTAKAGDLICVTGDLGGAYMGLQVLEREKQVYQANPDMQPELENRQYIVERLLKPEGRTDIIHGFKDLDLLPTSMIDVSDGLASDLMHICHSSGVSARLYEDKLPIDDQTFQAAREFNIDPTTCVLHGGEDYELLFTIRQEDFNKVKNHPDISVIGHITEGTPGIMLITQGGNAVPVNPQGWTHF